MALSLILLPGTFISYYTIIYFFVKNFFFKCLYFSEYDIWMFLFVFWLRNRPSRAINVDHLRNRGIESGYPKCLHMRTGGRRVSRFMCTFELISFHFFCLMMSCFICRNLTLPSLRKGAFVRDGYFSPMKSISVVMK